MLSEEERKRRKRERDKLYYQKNRLHLNKPYKNIPFLYGITTDDFETILRNQNYKCKICKKELEKGRETNIDHCHETSIVRGILCRACNLGLGFFKDNINFLHGAIEYLRGDKNVKSE